MAITVSASKTEMMMPSFDFQGKTYSIDTLPSEARSAINNLNFVKKLTTELQAKKIIVQKLLNLLQTDDNTELQKLSDKPNKTAVQDQLIEINNKLQVLDTARIAYSKQLQVTLVESDS